MGKCIRFRREREQERKSQRVVEKEGVIEKETKKKKTERQGGRESENWHGRVAMFLSLLVIHFEKICSSKKA